MTRARRHGHRDGAESDGDSAVGPVVRCSGGAHRVQPAASVRKPRYERRREPHIFLPAEVEQIRAKLDKLRDRTLVSVLAYSGPRPEEVVFRLAWEDIGERAIRYRDEKRHRPDIVREAFRIGASSYVLKDAMGEELLPAIQEAMRQPV